MDAPSMRTVRSQPSSKARRVATAATMQVAAAAALHLAQRIARLALMARW
jgi:hypothetical protein